MNFNTSLLVISMLLPVIISCENKPQATPLPIMGNKEVTEKLVDGEIITDTVFHTIEPFTFINQDSMVVNESTVDGKIYIADFFFASCPTICPKMHAQMKRVYQSIEDMDDVIIISHTMDPKHDSIAVLSSLATKYAVTDSRKWSFVTGDKDQIFELGNKSYMAALTEDPKAAGGNLHSGAFILVDRKRRIRGFYDGTKRSDVDALILDIKKLRQE